MDQDYNLPLATVSDANTDLSISVLHSEVSSLKDDVHSIQNVYQVPPQPQFYPYTVPWNQLYCVCIHPSQSYTQ